MMFSELYSAYYNTVAKLLAAAIRGELSQKTMRQIIFDNAFSESMLYLAPSVAEQKWKLIQKDFTTPIQHPPAMPLTLLQKRWLKAVLNDRRVRLFDLSLDGLEDVEPLFTEDDYCIFDQYADGDDFADEDYIKRFRLILDAMKSHYPLKLVLKNRKGRFMDMNVIPSCLEYSAKDDKFRLITSAGVTVNLGRVVACRKYAGDNIKHTNRQLKKDKSVTLEILDERNALERVMLHFAHFEKRAWQLDGNRYRVTVKYNLHDETELVIRVLSFGKFVKVVEPQSFVELIKQRLEKQRKINISHN